MSFQPFSQVFSEGSLIFATNALYYYKTCLCSETVLPGQGRTEHLFEEKTGHVRGRHDISLADATQR